MSDLSGFTDELDEELRSSSGEPGEDGPAERAVQTTCPHRVIFSGFCAECAPDTGCTLPEQTYASNFELLCIMVDPYSQVL